MPFPYKTVLITGATSGIGRALAESVIENGGFVIAAGRRKVRLDALVEQYGQDKVVAEVVDLSDLSALPAWTKKYAFQPRFEPCCSGHHNMPHRHT